MSVVLLNLLLFPDEQLAVSSYEGDYATFILSTYNI
jgi:hypothetical protein